uniref:DUF7588 domain-containing protein n=1 Tax=Solanum tuberosum TaxID=4113 RepID=M1DNV5_SOLTU
MKITMLKTSDTFNPDHSILHKLRTHPDNQTKRNWYVANYALNQREAFRDLWMANMERIGCEIEFFKWFEMTEKIENQIESLQMIINKWYTTSNKVVEFVTPHLEGLNIPVAGTIIKASPFKEKCDKSSSFVTPANIDRVVEQNNYSNQILHVISRQIEESKPSISRRPTPSSTLSSQNIKTNPVIEPFSMKQIMNLADNQSEPSISDLRHKVLKKAFLQESDSDHESSQGNDDDSINNDHLAEPYFTQTGNHTSTSAYLAAQNQKDTFASIAKEDTDDIKSYKKLQKKEMIFLLENSELQRKDEPWKIEQIAVDICADHPSAFWNRKTHIVTLPYEEGFSEDDIT